VDTSLNIQPPIIPTSYSVFGIFGKYGALPQRGLDYYPNTDILNVDTNLNFINYLDSVAYSLGGPTGSTGTLNIGTYSLTINSSGCIQTATTQVSAVNALPTVAVNSGSICSGNNFTIIPSGASTYTIQGGSANVTPTANASYTVIGTSTAGCVSANTATSNITVNGPQASTIWTGAVSTSFFDSHNWTNCACSAATNATIAAVTSPSFNPIISATAYVKSLTINPSASLSISSNQTLNVNGNWTNNGAFN
jgi:hypothetical protein